MNRFLAMLQGRIRFYIAVPEFTLALIGIALFWRPLANFVFGRSSLFSRVVSTPPWVSEVAVNVFANLIASGIVAVLFFWWIGKLKRHALAGRFKAFDRVNGADVEWGDLELRYPIFSAANKMRLRLQNGAIVVEGEGVINREQHFIGYYRDTSNIARRRYGAFMMVLDGLNSEYSGQYLFVDPVTADVKVGFAVWKRVV